MIYEILEKIYNFNFINKLESFNLFNKIYNNKLNKKQIIAFIISIKIRGYYIEEIIGAINLLNIKSKKKKKINFKFCDIVGMGGDNINSINISTASSLVASIYGVKILKHGNYSISSISGSFNIISKFNINLNFNFLQIINFLKKFNIYFINATKYNNIFNNIISIRKKIKSNTIFNIIGPLINPFKPPIILIGANNIKLIIIIIKILKIFKYKSAAVIYGGGMDEVSIHSNTYIAEFNKKKIKTYQLTPKIIGFKKYSLNKILNYSNKKNIFLNILNGKGTNAQNKIISMNVSLLLKLLGKNDLIKNNKTILKIIKSGYILNKIEKIFK
ncbi:MAG: anthranilate phosphoribosyltransferase [Enterobacteriaceae bacterium PSpyr]|nr:MAG: anthranilate phosphoribosyltransferase [Enterobacteriaceae bacterium PSpyr]